MVRQTVTANPELFLPVFLLFVWEITAIAVKPQTLGLALLMTLLLFGLWLSRARKTPWLRRLGWVSPRQGFWLYSVLAGLGPALASGRSPDRFTNPWAGRCVSSPRTPRSTPPSTSRSRTCRRSRKMTPHALVCSPPVALVNPDVQRRRVQLRRASVQALRQQSSERLPALRLDQCVVV